MTRRALQPRLFPSQSDESKKARNQFAAYSYYGTYGIRPQDLASIAVARFVQPQGVSPFFADTELSGPPDDLVTELMIGEHGGLEREDLQGLKRQLTRATIQKKAIFIFLLAVVIWLACWLTVDVNLTSIHGVYRDRLASAFLVGKDTKGDVTIEEDLDLDDICRYEARSIAPYHILNVALNLQGSKDIGIRDRNSDFFIFSKRFIGGHRTGYCRSETMEQVYPQLSLASAMAISAAAASPNMGRGTSRPLVAFMTLLNIRMGYWVPNPGVLEVKLNKSLWKRWKKELRQATKPPGFTFGEVFAQELQEIAKRWGQVYENDLPRHLDDKPQKPTVKHRLVGIGFSGGGIRTAAINLGITQALHQRGVFDHLDYMSTVSGGGYLGSSISTLMRSREKLVSEFAGTVTIETETPISEIAGTVTIERAKPVSGAAEAEAGQEVELDQIVIITPSDASETPRTYRFSGNAKLAAVNNQPVSKGQALLKYRDVVVTPSEAGEPLRIYQFSGEARLNVRDKENVRAGKPLLHPNRTRNRTDISGTVNVEKTQTEQIVRVQGIQPDEQRLYRFSRFDSVAVKTGDTVKPDQDLIQRHNTIGERFRWRVRPLAFLREMLSKLDETHRWVNLSDGGHIENLATIELLRRRCKYIIIGDGEADPELHFAGLATLMRSAYIDLGIEIDIELDAIRLRKDDYDAMVSGEQWAIGTIKYPKKDKDGQPEEGYLLYLKSSVTGHESEMIQEYRHRNPSFPHQTTADQFFDEGQFEAYRALGQHIAEQALTRSKSEKMSFNDLEEWFDNLRKNQKELDQVHTAARPQGGTRKTESST